MNYKVIAEAGARKLCGQSGCLGCYDCGHTNKSAFAEKKPIFPEYSVCPLAKYNVPEDKDTRKWYERPRAETEPTREELFALCACCENTSGAERTDAKHVSCTPKEWKRCIGCPVNMAREAMDELEAEACLS